MKSFACGFLGALLCAAVFCAGVYAERMGPRFRTVPDTSGEEKKDAEQKEAEQRMRYAAEVEAFNRMQRYTPEQAYGVREE